MRLALIAVTLLGTLGLAQAADDIFDAARRGDVAAVKAALDAGTPVDAKWRYEQTALYIAAFRGHVPVVRLLLERGASPDARDTFYKMSALDAASDKNPEILGLLVAKGAKGGEKLLPAAAAGGRKIMVQTLLANGKWPQDVLDQSLLAAELKKQSEVAGMLREAGAKALPKPEIDAAVLALLPGRYTAPNIPAPATVVFEDGLLKLNGLGRPFEYRPVDGKTFVSLMEPATDKIVFEIEVDKVKGFDFSNAFTKLRFTPEAK